MNLEWYRFDEAQMKHIYRLLIQQISKNVTPVQSHEFKIFIRRLSLFKDTKTEDIS